MPCGLSGHLSIRVALAYTHIHVCKHRIKNPFLYYIINIAKKTIIIQGDTDFLPGLLLIYVTLHLGL